jgi:hypothetical protein
MMEEGLSPRQLILTAHRCALPEDGCDLGIQCNCHVVVFSDLGVACFHLLLCPCQERWASDGPDDVSNVTARQLQHFSLPLW